MHLTLECRGNLTEDEYTGLEKYFQLVLDKIESGRAEYGMDYLERSDNSFLDQLQQELADMTGWPAMRFLKLRALRKPAAISPTPS